MWGPLMSHLRAMQISQYTYLSLDAGAGDAGFLARASCEGGASGLEDASRLITRGLCGSNPVLWPGPALSAFFFPLSFSP